LLSISILQAGAIPFIFFFIIVVIIIFLIVKRRKRSPRRDYDYTVTRNSNQFYGQVNNFNQSIENNLVTWTFSLVQQQGSSIYVTLQSKYSIRGILQEGDWVNIYDGTWKNNSFFITNLWNATRRDKVIAD